MIIYQPYTYLIGWSIHNKWYYGAEYGKLSKIANPNNLWKTYFTSSKVVKHFRKFFGEPDVVQIRKTFFSAEQAINWESRVISKVLYRSPSKWLNKSIPGIGFHTQNMMLITDGTHQYMLPNDIKIPDGWSRGRSAKNRENSKNGSRKRIIHFNDEARIKCKEKIENSFIITNQHEDIYWPKNVPIPEGYKRGRSDVFCKRASDIRKGISHTEERKNNISSSRKNFKYITNGKIELQTKNGILPEGFKWGRLEFTKAHRQNNGNAKKNMRWYNNGKKDIQINPIKEIVPDGFYSGRVKGQKQSKESVEKRSESLRGYKWYNNGIKNIRVNRGQSFPEGFVPGKLCKPYRTKNNKF